MVKKVTFHISWFYIIVVSADVTSCATTSSLYNPHQKFSVKDLTQDYDLFQHILEERHPSLYWYTPKPKMDSIFNCGKRNITDSMTEYDFRKILLPVISSI